MTIGFMDNDYRFNVVRFDRFTAQEEPDRILEQVAHQCRLFRLRILAADGGGNGHVYNRLLVDRLQQQAVLYAVLYSQSEQAPRQDGVLWVWTVN
jgi:hypothetical protein